MDPAHPDGWILLARTYTRLQRYDEAAMAYGRAIALLGDEAPADLWSAYGEVLALAAGGRVTAEAKTAFETALKIDPKDEPARYYLALHKAQNGDTAAALASSARLGGSSRRCPSSAAACPSRLSHSSSLALVMTALQFQRE